MSTFLRGQETARAEGGRDHEEAPQTAPGQLGDPGGVAPHPGLGVHFFCDADSIFWIERRNIGTAIVAWSWSASSSLGGLNIYKKITWKEPTDGVTWGEGPNGLTALKVEVNSPAYLASIKKGDILYAINNIPIKTKIDLVKTLWIARDVDQKVSYQIGREGELITPSFYLQKKGVNLIYFYLALIGLTTLVIGLIVFFNSPPPPVPALHLLLSPLGGLLRLLSFLPDRQLRSPGQRLLLARQGRLPRLSAPAPPFLPDLPPAEEVPQAAGRRSSPSSICRRPASPGAPRSSSTGPRSGLERRRGPPLPGPAREASTFSISPSTPSSPWRPSSTAPRHPQLPRPETAQVDRHRARPRDRPLHRCSTSSPSWPAGRPRPRAELTVLLQALIPLTFAYSISRYKLMDLEILLKKAVTLIFSYLRPRPASISSSAPRPRSSPRTGSTPSSSGSWPSSWAATLFTPAEEARPVAPRPGLLQEQLRVPEDAPLHQQGDQPGAEPGEPVPLAPRARSPTPCPSRTIALFLADEADAAGRSSSSGAGAGRSPSPRSLVFDEALFEQMLRRTITCRITPARTGGAPRRRSSASSRFGFEHFLALKVEDKIIGCLAMGRKTDGTFLTSEDWELLTTDLLVRRPGPRERLPLQPGQRPGPGAASGSRTTARTSSRA